MIEKPYTIEEHRAFLAALAEVDMDLPVAQNPNELYSKDEIRQILKCLNDRMDNDPSVKDDGPWMRMWEQIVAIADYKGIVADSDEDKTTKRRKPRKETKGCRNESYILSPSRRGGSPIPLH